MTVTQINPTQTTTTTPCRATACPYRGSERRQGWCTRHHGIARATGRDDLTGRAPIVPRHAPIATRFAAYTVATPGGCLLWTGGLTGDGYGIFAAPAGRHAGREHPPGFRLPPRGAPARCLTRLSHLGPRHV
jgi:hypothetical protein